MTNGFNHMHKTMRGLHLQAMNEIKDVRNELKTDIDTLYTDVHTIKSDVKNLRFEVHQNQTALIVNNLDLEKRVAALEATAA